MKTFSFVFLILLLPYSTSPKWWTLDQSVLADRITGGWAGQMLGTAISEREVVFAHADSSRSTAASSIIFQVDNRRLSEHLYYDLLFVDAFRARGGGDFSDSFVAQFAASSFMNTHAFAAARKNWKKDLKQPWSGKWTNNPHAHDPDFARGAEVFGLLYPAMPRPLERATDAIGHLSNSGDGYYAGVFLATLTSIGFVVNDPEKLVREALKAIPMRSEFHRCITEVLGQYQSEKDWLLAWQFMQRKWKKDTGCPAAESTIHDDARMYAAFVTFAYLYGNNDIQKCVSIAREVPEGIDALPAILGLVGATKGFEYFPDDFKLFVSSMTEAHLDASLMTLQEAINQTITAAKSNIDDNGGRIKNNGQILIPRHSASAVSNERTFQGHYISKVQEFNFSLTDQFEFEFEGVGFVLLGKNSESQVDPAVAELYLNHKYIDRIVLPDEKNENPVDFCWKFQLTHNKYKGKIRLLKRDSVSSYEVTKLVVYDIMPPVSERQLR